MHWKMRYLGLVTAAFLIPYVLSSAAVAEGVEINLVDVCNEWIDVGIMLGEQEDGSPADNDQDIGTIVEESGSVGTCDGTYTASCTAVIGSGKIAGDSSVATATPEECRGVLENGVHLKMSYLWEEQGSKEKEIPRFKFTTTSCGASALEVDSGWDGPNDSKKKSQTVKGSLSVVIDGDDIPKFSVYECQTFVHADLNRDGWHWWNSMYDVSSDQDDSTLVIYAI